jgi:hypothetical protein
VCCASTSGVIGDYAEQSFWKHVSCIALLMLCTQLCTSWRHMVGIEVQLHSFLSMVIDGGDWSASPCSRFTSGVRGPGNHLVGGWWAPEKTMIFFNEENGLWKTKHDCLASHNISIAIPFPPSILHTLCNWKYIHIFNTVPTQTHRN